MSAPNNERMPSKVTRERLEVKACYPSEVSYEGTREQLLEAGVAIPAMFPDPPATRRWSRNNSDRQGIVADSFAVTKKPDDQWRVTREKDWHDPIGFLRRKAAEEAERNRYWAEQQKESRVQSKPTGRPDFKEYAEERLPDDFHELDDDDKYEAMKRIQSDWLKLPNDGLLAAKETFIDFIDSAAEDMEEAASRADPEMTADIRPIQALFESTDETSRARCRALQVLVNIWACPIVNTDLWPPI